MKTRVIDKTNRVHWLAHMVAAAGSIGKTKSFAGKICGEKKLTIRVV